MFALAVETRQYTKLILYPVLCQVNFSKFILYPKLHFSECEMGIMWKKTIQAHVKALVLECTLSPALHHVSGCDLTHRRDCLFFQGVHVFFRTDVASPYKPHVLSIFTCWHEAGDHKEEKNNF